MIGALPNGQIAVQNPCISLPREMSVTRAVLSCLPVIGWVAHQYNRRWYEHKLQLVEHRGEELNKQLQVIRDQRDVFNQKLSAFDYGEELCLDRIVQHNALIPKINPKHSNKASQKQHASEVRDRLFESEKKYEVDKEVLKETKKELKKELDEIRADIAKEKQATYDYILIMKKGLDKAYSEKSALYDRKLELFELKKTYNYYMLFSSILTAGIVISLNVVGLIQFSSATSIVLVVVVALTILCTGCYILELSDSKDRITDQIQDHRQNAEEFKEYFDKALNKSKKDNTVSDALYLAITIDDLKKDAGHKWVKEPLLTNIVTALNEYANEKRKVTELSPDRLKEIFKDATEIDALIKELKKEIPENKHPYFIDMETNTVHEEHFTVREMAVVRLHAAVIDVKNLLKELKLLS